MPRLLLNCLAPQDAAPLALPALPAGLRLDDLAAQHWAGLRLRAWQMEADAASLDAARNWLEQASQQQAATDQIFRGLLLEEAPAAARLVLQGPQLDGRVLRRALDALHLAGFAAAGPLRANGAAVLQINVAGAAADLRLLNHRLAEAVADLSVDAAVCPADWQPGHFGLLLTDMDSTLISIECIDELADMAGLKPQVAAITERAMQGELDFAASLKARVALLAGLPESMLERVYQERLRLNPGAERLVAGLRAQGCRVGVVSGGFTFFTDRLKARLGLDYAFANTLEIKGGKLTGRVLGEIVDAQGKARILEALARENGLALSRCIAMGDGANDLPMLQKAGLGIAYRAKPVVRAQADYSIQHTGLDGVLALMGDGAGAEC